MRRFESMAHVQLFLSVLGPVQKLFRFARRQLKAVHYRLLRQRAFTDWKEVTCAC